jgi:hypothetical protein
MADSPGQPRNQRGKSENGKPDHVADIASHYGILME